LSGQASGRDPSVLDRSVLSDPKASGAVPSH